MMGLSEAFYKKCVEDPDEWFSHMFLGKSDFIGDQNEYLMQRLGGPSYYSDRKGHPNLIASHAHLEMTSRTAGREMARPHGGNTGGAGEQRKCH